MVSGGPLDSGIRTALYLAACEILQDKKKCLDFVDENATGRVTTNYNHVFMSSAMRGIEFTAVIETNHSGQINCRFLVNDRHVLTESEALSGNYSWVT